MIRKAQKEDLPRILEIYVVARQFMVANGNPNQWVDGYPSEHMLMTDIAAGHLYVEEVDDALHAAFVYIIGEDPTYGVIENGAWLSNAPYGTIHRLATDGIFPGFFDRCVAFCREQLSHLRMDTHADNKVMQHLAETRGFTRCGIIHLADGAPRIAYERV